VGVTCIETPTVPAVWHHNRIEKSIDRQTAAEERQWRGNLMMGAA